MCAGNTESHEGSGPQMGTLEALGIWGHKGSKRSCSFLYWGWPSPSPLPGTHQCDLRPGLTEGVSARPPGGAAPPARSMTVVSSTRIPATHQSHKERHKHLTPEPVFPFRRKTLGSWDMWGAGEIHLLSDWQLHSP